MKQPLFSTSYAPRDGESTLDEIERTVANDSEVGISLTEAAIEFILAAVRSPQD